MPIQSKQLAISSKPRGFHIITDEILVQLSELKIIKSGLLYLHLLHTSASLSINENADPDVRHDMEYFFNKYVKENAPGYRHTCEGPDDMPAHIKSSILGVQLQIAIENGKLVLGTWQGIYLGEHRNHGGSRRIQATMLSD